MIEQTPTKTCSKCKIIKSLDSFHKQKAIKSGIRSYCKDCGKNFKSANRILNKAKLNKYSIDYYYKNKEHLKKKEKEYSASTNGRYKCFLKHARRCNLTTGISLVQFTDLMIKDCFYCEQELPKTGCCLDRIDSNQNYDLQNVVPCCHICNRMKMDHSSNLFFKHIELIYNKHLREII